MLLAGFVRADVVAVVDSDCTAVVAAVAASFAVARIEGCLCSASMLAVTQRLALEIGSQAVLVPSAVVPATAL